MADDFFPELLTVDALAEWLATHPLRPNTSGTPDEFDDFAAARDALFAARQERSRPNSRAARTEARELGEAFERTGQAALKRYQKVRKQKHMSAGIALFQTAMARPLTESEQNIARQVGLDALIPKSKKINQAPASAGGKW